jgi:YVTN family beta-propeller protein
MKRVYLFISILFFLEGCEAQPAQNSQELSLINTISLPGVSGRIDHLAFDPRTQRVFVAALGNNTVEIVDLKTSKVIHSISQLSEPQGIAFIASNNSIVVANGGTGVCDVFNAVSFEKTNAIQLQGDADNVRYDSINSKIYVGYGDGGIAIIDAVTFKQVGDIKLEGHPESFQIDGVAKKIYVNVPGKQQIEVIDLDKNQVTDRWKMTEARSNFPMSLDVANHRLFIGCRRPAKLLVLDNQTGKLITSVETDSDVDDVFYDQPTKNIYMSCGGGYIDIIKQQSSESYQLSGKVSTKSGARTSLMIPQLRNLLVVSPKSISDPASLLIYRINK